MATVTPPSNIGYGTVKGRFIGDEIDGVDGDSNPDFYAPTGTMVFTASVRKNLDPTASPDPATVVRRYIPGILDDQGYVCVPIPDPANAGQMIAGARTIKLIATNDPDLNPVDWNWRVDFNFRDQRGDQIDMPGFSFDLPEGGTIDLTTVAPVDSSTGDAIVVGPQGRSVVSITKTGTAGPVDTYTISYSDATTSTFTITNGVDGIDGLDGVGIASIVLHGTAGLVKTYRITFTDASNFDFDVTDGAVGPRGSKWFTGHGAPGTIGGSLPGDEYLDVDTGDIYELS